MVELLAPAGSYESLVAAVNAGADAVYIGGQKFGARAYADNPLEDALLSGITYAHHFGVKVYMTVNTLLKEREMKELYDYLLPYYMAGLDAVIVQDLGVFDFIRRNFPNMDIHASTQMSIMGYESVRRLQELGICRVVPARELSLEEIRLIRRNTRVEIECFVHGALCYAYSGQCLMSSLIGGRSANRGRCAQTCRLSYDAYTKGEGKAQDKKLASQKTLLSCKDLCSLDILPDIIEAGVDSLKIEGRMKSPVYTAGVVRIWRKYLDLYQKKGREKYKVETADRRELLLLFDRGGQTDGYYEKHNGKDMLVLEGKAEKRKVDEQLFAYLDEHYVSLQKKHPLDMHAKLHKNKPMQLEISICKESGESLQVFTEGEIPALAMNRSITSEEVQKQLRKLGNTFYELNELQIDLDEGIFIPVKQLNDLRRDALQLMDAAILSGFYREKLVKREIFQEKKAELRELSENMMHIFCETEEQLESAKKYLSKAEKGAEEYWHFSVAFEADTIQPEFWKKQVEECHALGLKIGLYMPHIFRLESRQFFDRYKVFLQNAGFDRLVIRSMEESEYIHRIFSSDMKKPKLCFDYTMYNYNHAAADMLRVLGANSLTLPVELNLHELRELGCEGMEAVVYGRLPMMVSAQCIKKTTTGCDHKPQLLYIKDRREQDMPVKNRCSFCYNSIYNAKPLSTLGIAGQIKGLGVNAFRLMFTTESAKEVEAVIAKYIRVYIRQESCEENMEIYTRGHYKRGIE